jgi:hypothetical protein
VSNGLGSILYSLRYNVLTVDAGQWAFVGFALFGWLRQLMAGLGCFLNFGLDVFHIPLLLRE